MTIIFSEDFEGGSPGAPVTTSNTALDGVDGEPTFTDEYVVEGNLGFLTDGSSGLSRGALAHPPAAAHIQAFIYFVTVPSTNTPIIVWYQGRPGAGISQVGDLQYRTGGQLAIRDGYTAVWQSTAQFTAGSWVRVQILCDAGQEHRLRLFYGANLMGTEIGRASCRERTQIVWHTRWPRDWSSDVCSSDLQVQAFRRWATFSTAQGDNSLSATATRLCGSLRHSLRLEAGCECRFCAMRDRNTAYDCSTGRTSWGQCRMRTAAHCLRGARLLLNTLDLA